MAMATMIRVLSIPSEKITIIIIIIIIEGFIDRKIDTNRIMHLSPRKDIPGTDMGQYLKSTSQGMTKGVCVCGGGGGGRGGIPI